MLEPLSYCSQETYEKFWPSRITAADVQPDEIYRFMARIMDSKERYGLQCTVRPIGVYALENIVEVEYLDTDLHPLKSFQFQFNDNDEINLRGEPMMFYDHKRQQELTVVHGYLRDEYQEISDFILRESVSIEAAGVRL